MRWLHTYHASLPIVQSQKQRHLARNERDGHPPRQRKMTTMALLDLSRDQGGTRPTGLLADGLSRLTEALARHSLYRQTVRELSALGDRELSDLGMNRAAIRSVAWSAAAATRG